MLGRPIWATLWTAEEPCTKSTVTASCSPGAESVAVSPVSRTSASQMRPGQSTQVEALEYGVPELDESEREAVAARWRARAPRTGPPASVASSRETVLALMPVRRAISFVPSSPPSASASSTAERPLDRGDVTDGWLAGAGRGTLLQSVFETPLPGRQFL